MIRKWGISYVIIGKKDTRFRDWIIQERVVVEDGNCGYWSVLEYCGVDQLRHYDLRLKSVDLLRNSY